MIAILNLFRNAPFFLIHIDSNQFIKLSSRSHPEAWGLSSVSEYIFVSSLVWKDRIMISPEFRELSPAYYVKVNIWYRAF